MNQRGGMATIALLIAAVLGVSYFPRKAAESPGSQPAQTGASGVPASGASSKPPTAAASKPIPSCEQIAKRLRRFYRPNEQPPMPVSCYPQGTRAPAKDKSATNPSLSFAIAIVPNPVQTHLPLVFDRAIESIQQAAQDVNYIYDGSWFPWNHSDKSYESLSDEEQAAKLEAELQEQPGIMVFRRGFDNEKVDDTWSKCETGPGSGVVKPNCLESKDGEFANHYERDLVVFVVAE